MVKTPGYFWCTLALAKFMFPTAIALNCLLNCRVLYIKSRMIPKGVGRLHFPTGGSVSHLDDADKSLALLLHTYSYLPNLHRQSKRQRSYDYKKEAFSNSLPKIDKVRNYKLDPAKHKTG